MKRTLILLLALGLAVCAFPVEPGTSNVFNIVASDPNVGTFIWQANDAPQANSSSSISFDLVSSTKNGSLRATVTNHAGNTLTVNNTGFNLPLFTFYEDGVEKQSGSSNTYTPTSPTSTIVIRVDGLAFIMIAAKGPAINVWEPIVQGMAGNPKKIQLSKPAELGAQSGSKILYRVNGGGVSEATGSSVQITMPSGSATLEFWSSADGFADSLHETTSWNSLMI